MSVNLFKNGTLTKIARGLKDAAVTITNNLLATEPGTALDAVQGKVLDDKITEVNNSLTFPDGTIFYADIKDGKPGFNTDSGRGADTFFPFSSGGGSFVADWISCKIINALTYYAPNMYNSNMCSLSETDLIINKSGTLEVDSGVLAQNSNETKFNLYINDVVKISHSNKGSYSNNVFSEQLQVEAGDVIKVQMKSGKSGVEGGAIFVCLHFIE